ncbi:hypothetical protein MH117_07485 [Paenibacillus sp. ACRRX]|uniref:hypothetical protein n=1 Tax=unclassified Paenibacillus TaxID=185978 RepID=UPI001EF59450|nr:MULTISPECIES: hypothetical protein [unclassified Paenibacillus]MCG7407257.1 hypothetical protein [Paenibacillus sp. ACRRX]MDK8180476.1 hypothetical protein [Paenibacillus sp. UMB4589-SE434]
MTKQTHSRYHFFTVIMMVLVLLGSLCLPLLAAQSEPTIHQTIEFGSNLESADAMLVRKSALSVKYTLLHLILIVVMYRLFISSIRRICFPYHSTYIATAIRRLFLMPIKRTTTAIICSL